MLGADFVNHPFRAEHNRCWGTSVGCERTLCQIVVVYQSETPPFSASAENLVDREFINRGPAGVIAKYYKAGLFYIDYIRKYVQDERLYTEFEIMAKDLES